MTGLHALIATWALVLVACSGDPSAAPRPAGPVEVEVITIEPAPLKLTKELPGRISALRVAEVRARVNGIVQKRMFVEGSDVKRDQALYRIDPAPYQVALESAQAQLARAQTVVASTKALRDRYATLTATDAISKQEYDDAVTRFESARADVAAAAAAVRAARINVGYTTVTAPISGRIGRTAVTEGGYVQQSTATLLATIQQVDRVYVDLTWSSAEALSLRRARERGSVQDGADQTAVTLILADGEAYPEPGVLQFTDASVDESTGSLSLRALVPNPRGELMPGMFVRARIEEGTVAAAILVPQRAVTRDASARPTAFVVGQGDKIEVRHLAADRQVGSAWLVTAGLAAGDRVVVEGLQKIRPGQVVSPVSGAPTKEARR